MSRSRFVLARARSRHLLTEWNEDRVPDLAAQVAFYAILSLFPAFLALAALLGVLDSVVGDDVAGRVEAQVLEFLRTILTNEADNTIQAVDDLFAEARPGLLTFSLVAALWTLSRGFAALVRALDVVYDLDEHRPWVRIRGTALALTLGSIVSGAVLLALIVIGPLFGTGQDVAATIGLGDQFAFLWDVVRLPVAFALLVVWAATIFHIAPDHHTPWRADFPGALVTGVLWIVFSGALRIYVEVAQSGNAVFGALGGVLIVLLWFWLLALAVMIGGEVNQVLLVDRGSAASDDQDERRTGVAEALPVRACAGVCRDVHDVASRFGDQPTDFGGCEAVHLHLAHPIDESCGQQAKRSTDERRRRCCRDLEDEHAGPGPDGADQIADVAPAQRRRHVLEHPARVDEIELLAVEDREICSCVEQEAAAPTVSVDLLCGSDHRRCDVDPDDLVHVPRETMDQSSCPTSEVERPTPRFDSQAGEVPEDPVDLHLPRGQELVHVPPVPGTRPVGQHRPHRIVPAEVVPPGLHRSQVVFGAVRVCSAGPRHVRKLPGAAERRSIRWRRAQPGGS